MNDFIAPQSLMVSWVSRNILMRITGTRHLKKADGVQDINVLDTPLPSIYLYFLQILLTCIISVLETE